MANSYYPNTLVRVSVAFTAAGVATDPTTVTCKVKDPTGVVTTYASPVKDSVGNYHQDVTVVPAGIWFYEWAGTGALIAESEATFTVLTSQVG